jgi:hypothetical protein
MAFEQMKRHWVLGLSLLVLLGCTEKDGASATRQTVENGAFALHDLEGRRVDPFATNSAACVFFFVGCECPISNRYAPEMRHLFDRFAGKGIRFWIVYTEADASPERIRQHIREYDLQGTVLRDVSHDFARFAKAHVTPQVAVFDRDRRLVYHGRIDDRYAALGSDRGQPTTRDLQDVLEAITSGRPVTTASSPAFGCRIAGVE